MILGGISGGFAGVSPGYVGVAVFAAGPILFIIGLLLVIWNTSTQSNASLFTKLADVSLVLSILVMLGAGLAK